MAEDFERKIQAWVNKTKRTKVTTVEKVCMQLTTSVVMRTPVDTGRARGNWQPSLDSIASGTTDRTSKAGASVIRNAKTEAKQAHGRRFFLVNNLPYIKKLEDGSSNQAPAGMVAVTVAAFKGIVRQVL